MTTQHTPGPWEMYTTAGGSTIKIRESTSPHGYGSVIVKAVSPRIHDCSGLPNARLIAAAPDLLAACEGLMKLIDDNILVRNIEGDGDPQWAMAALKLVKTLRGAQDAIAKTKGEPE